MDLAGHHFRICRKTVVRDLKAVPVRVKEGDGRTALQVSGCAGDVHLHAHGADASDNGDRPAHHDRLGIHRHAANGEPLCRRSQHTGRQAEALVLQILRADLEAGGPHGGRPDDQLAVTGNLHLHRHGTGDCVKRCHICRRAEVVFADPVSIPGPDLIGDSHGIAADDRICLPGIGQKFPVQDGHRNRFRPDHLRIGDIDDCSPDQERHNDGDQLQRQIIGQFSFHSSSSPSEI